MAKNYYSLVAGLYEYALDADKKGFDAPAIIAEIRGELSREDRECMDLLYNYYDIENIINLTAGHSRFSDIGNFTKEELVKEMKSPSELPEYIERILSAYSDPENTDYDDIDTGRPIEKSLFEAYYNECSKSKCRFLREWSEFDRNLRNVSAALAARQRKIRVAGVLVGGGYVADTLASNAAADFGLSGELGYIDQVMSAVGSGGNILEKENKIDLIRWNMSDELATFDYFDINKILAYLVKINIVYRWVSLDAEYGKRMFGKLLTSLEGSGYLKELLK